MNITIMIKKFKSKFRTIVVVGLLGFGTSGSFMSCNFLDIDPYINDMFNLDTVFAKKEYCMQYLYNVYSYLPNSGDFRRAPWTPVTDECLVSYKRSNHPYNYFCNNEWEASDEYGLNYWPTYYEGIRKVNTFLQRVYECEELTSIQLQESVAEAQFLRAYFYFELMLQYGPVTIMPDKPVDLDAPMDQLLLPRNTWSECVAYVEDNLRLAMKGLPDERADASLFGKPAKASALAVLSRLTLYNASRLYNKDASIEFSSFVNQKGVHYFDQQYSEEKWAKAAAVAKELVLIKPNDLHTVAAKSNTPHFPHAFQANYPDGVGGIDPYHSYIDMFNGETVASDNPEILFARSSTNTTYGGHEWLRFMAPKQMEGFGSLSVTQSLVDAYYMIDGHTIEDASAEYPYLQSGYTERDSVFSDYILKSGVHNLYTNREMRFYATVGFNNSYYFAISGSEEGKKNFKVNFYKDGGSGKNTALKGDADKDDYSMTGYLCRKFVHPEDSYAKGGTRRHKVWMCYRMAEVYLNYVEALNELSREYTIGGISVARDKEEIKKYFNMIRFRAGLPGITDTEAVDVQKMRDLIARERQIEFAWEGRRYFDVRRCRMADNYENQPIKGCDVNKNGTNDEKDLFYSKVVVKERNYSYKIFTKRQYFWPIPKYEADKNPNLDQNPGY